MSQKLSNLYIVNILYHLAHFNSSITLGGFVSLFSGAVNKIVMILMVTKCCMFKIVKYEFVHFSKWFKCVLLALTCPQISHMLPKFR